MSSETAVYYLALATLVLVMAGMLGIRRSRFGRALMALRDNERAAQAYGIEASRTHLAAFALSGAIAALAGGLFMHHERYFDPASYSPIENLAVFTMVVVGGMSSLAGAVLGALFLLGGRWFLDTQWQFLASGLGVLAILLLAPAGLAGLAARGRDAALRALARARGLQVPGYSATLSATDPSTLTGTPDPAPPAVGAGAPAGVADAGAGADGGAGAGADRAGVGAAGARSPGVTEAGAGSLDVAGSDDAGAEADAGVAPVGAGAGADGPLDVAGTGSPGVAEAGAGSLDVTGSDDAGAEAGAGVAPGGAGAGADGPLGVAEPEAGVGAGVAGWRWLAPGSGP